MNNKPATIINQKLCRKPPALKIIRRYNRNISVHDPVNRHHWEISVLVFFNPNIMGPNNQSINLV